MAAATAAIAGVAISGITAGMSFAQAGKERRLMNEANRAADQAMAEARKRLDVNVYDQLSVFDRVYKDAQEQSRGQALQQMQASQEADQGAVATAGKLQAIQNDQQNQIAMAHGMKLEELDKLSATEQGRLLDIGTQIDLAEVEGNQQAAADAQKQMAKSMGNAFSSVAQGVQYGAQLVPLYMQTAASKKADAAAASSFSKPQTPEERAEAEKYMKPFTQNPFEDYNSGYNPYLQGTNNFNASQFND